MLVVLELGLPRDFAPARSPRGWVRWGGGGGHCGTSRRGCRSGGVPAGAGHPSTARPDEAASARIKFLSV